MALTNKLAAIGDAIREKTNTTALLTLDEMATAIQNITVGSGGTGECSGLHVPEEALTIEGNCKYMFSNGKWDWFIENYADKLTFGDINIATSMFESSKLEEIPFEFNCVKSSSSATTTDVTSMFKSCQYLRKAPYIVGTPGTLAGLLSGCYRLTEIPEDWADKIDWSYLHSNGTLSNAFNDLRCIRRIPQSLIDKLRTGSSTASNSQYNNFSGCYVLDEVNNYPVNTKTITSNMFGGFVGSCYRLKTLTFETQEDGSPIVTSWKTQTINLGSNIGSGLATSYITDYSDIHGITDSKKVKDAETYQALKNDPDWFTGSSDYSRFNRDSAVALINSLPDTSAYLASAGGTNTIKLKGTAGKLTDGGAINTMTEEEIAVATAKGWTVTFA